MDARLQALERRWRSEGTPEAGVAYLLAFERTATDEQVIELLRLVGVRRWRLVGVGGPVEGQVFPLLREAVYRLAAGEDADLRLPGSVAGHAVLEVRQRGPERTCELSGGDGVRVEGQALVGTRPLADGDLLELDVARFVVEAQPETPDHRVPEARRAWLTVLAPAARAGERLAFTDALPLSRLVAEDDRRLEWDADDGRWVLRRPGRTDAPVALGDVISLGARGSRVEARFVALPDPVARADVRAHVERALAREGEHAEAGRALATAGPDAGRTIVLRRGANLLAPGLALQVDLDAAGTGWIVTATDLAPDLTWTVQGAGVYRGPDDGEVQPGRVVARSRGGRRELRCASVCYELAIGAPLAPIVDAYLVVTDGPDAGLRFPLRLGATRVGADGDCDVVLTDATARGREAVITVHRGWRPTLDPPAWGPPFTWRPASAREERPLDDGDVVEVGATRLVLRPCTVGGPPRAWLTRLDGARPGEAFAVDELGLTLGGLPWAAWDLAHEASRLGSVKVQPAGDGHRLSRGPTGDASIEGHPGRDALEDGDVIVVAGSVRLRFDLAAGGRGEAPRVEGARLRPEPEPFARAEPAPVAPAPPPFTVVRDVDLETGSPSIALSPAGELLVVKDDAVALHTPGGELAWERPGGRRTEPWQPRPHAVAFAHDGRPLVAYSDGVLEVLDAGDGRTVEQLRPPGPEAMIYLSATLVASAAEPLALVVGPRDASSFERTRDLRVVAWDLERRQVRWRHELTVGRRYPRPVLPRTGSAFYMHVDRCRPGGFEFVDSVVSRGRTWDGAVEPLPSPEGRPISAIADLDPDHVLVVAGGRLARWSRAEPTSLRPFAPDGGEARRGPLAVSPDGRFAACAGEQALELWHVGNGRRLHAAPLPGDRVLELALRDDGHAFVVTFPARLRQVAFDLSAEPPPPLPEADTWESTLKQVGAWIKGLFFEES